MSAKSVKSVAALRRRLAQSLLARARETLEDAEGLYDRGRLRACAILGCEAVADAARAFLVLWGLDPGADLAGTSALFDRQVIETGLVSPALSLAVHRAVRMSREIREGPMVVVYDARAARLLEGARQLVTEAEIVLAPLLEVSSPPRRERLETEDPDDLPDMVEPDRV